MATLPTAGGLAPVLPLPPDVCLSVCVWPSSFTSYHFVMCHVCSCVLLLLSMGLHLLVVVVDMPIYVHTDDGVLTRIPTYA